MNSVITRGAGLTFTIQARPGPMLLVVRGLADGVAGLPGHCLDFGGVLGDGESVWCGGQGERRR